MNGAFIAFIVLCVITMIAAGVKWFASSQAVRLKEAGETYDARAASDASRVAHIAMMVLAGIALVLGLSSMITVVPANEVGVVTNLGAWGGTRTSGPSLTPPWSTVDTFGTRNQKSIRDQAEGNGTCVNVKFKGGDTGCADLTVLYTIDEQNAEKLWRGWKDFSKLNGDLIERQTDDATISVYSGYTPLEASGAKRNELSEHVYAELDKRLRPEGVSLNSITLGEVHLPEKTQNNLNDLIAADTRLQIAIKGEEQAKAESRTAAARQQSLTPEALILECLNAAREIKPQVMPTCGLGAKTDAGVLVGVK